MSSTRLSRIETSLIASDAELLANVAARRGTTVAELVRQAIYAHVEPLQRAQKEREAIAWREVEEQRKIREWNGQQ